MGNRESPWPSWSVFPTSVPFLFWTRKYPFPDKSEPSLTVYNYGTFQKFSHRQTIKSGWLCLKRFSTEGIQNLGYHRASFRTRAGRSYTKRVSLSPLGKWKKFVRLRTLPLVIYPLFITFCIFFLTISNSNLCTGIRCFLVKRGRFNFKNS